MGQDIEALLLQVVYLVLCLADDKLAEKMNYTVIAVDSSAEMLERAKRLYSGNKINWIESTFEKLSIPAGSISMAVACLSFHFVADLQGLIKRCADWLTYDGMLIFSVRHPIRTANPTGETQTDGELCWSIKNYFTEGPRHFSWLGSDCINYHRPLSAYFSYLHNAGFVVEAVAEPSTSDDRLTFNAESRSVPFVLTIASRKRKHP
jgi:SAM-dependent methyltransferase